MADEQDVNVNARKLSKLALGEGLAAGSDESDDEVEAELGRGFLTPVSTSDGHWDDTYGDSLPQVGDVAPLVEDEVYRSLDIAGPVQDDTFEEREGAMLARDAVAAQIASGTVPTTAHALPSSAQPLPHVRTVLRLELSHFVMSGSADAVMASLMAELKDARVAFDAGRPHSLYCTSFRHYIKTTFSVQLYAGSGLNRVVVEFQRRTGDGFHFATLFASIRDAIAPGSGRVVSNAADWAFAAPGKMPAASAAPGGFAAAAAAPAPAQSADRLAAASPIMPSGMGASFAEPALVMPAGEAGAATMESLCDMLASPFVEERRQGCVLAARLAEAPTGAQTLCSARVLSLLAASFEYRDPCVQRCAVSAAANLAGHVRAENEAARRALAEHIPALSSIHESTPCPEHRRECGRLFEVMQERGLA